MVRSKLFVGSLVAVTSLSAFILTSTTANAETYTRSARIEVASACTLSGAVATAHTANVSIGTYRSDIGETVLSAVCNDAGGFGIYAIGYTGDTDGNNKLVKSDDNTTFINTGLAENGGTSAWAMKLTPVTNAATPTIENGYDSYSVVPDDYVKVASYPSTTTASASSMFKTYYAAYISASQSAGTYNGKVKYVMVHPSNGDAPEKKGAEPYPEDPCDSDENCDSTSGVTLQRAYELAYTAAHKGMYEETTPGSNTFQYIDSWNGVQYQGNGRDVRFLIQDMTPSICNTATVIGSTALVLDIRDQTSYRIVKAADGRCWMQDNLALDPVANGSSLTSQNTNASQDAINNYLASSGTAPQAGWTAIAVSRNETSLYPPEQPRIYILSVSTVPQGSDDPLRTLAFDEEWKIGVYYSYCAASMGTYCYSLGQGIDKASNSAIDADQDICPAGWRMPTGGAISSSGTTAGGGEYQTLYNAYPTISGGDTQYIRVRKALRLPLSGTFSSSAPGGQGDSAFFWTSTYMSSYGMNILSYDKSSFAPQDGISRVVGYTIRCIAKTGTEP